MKTTGRCCLFCGELKKLTREHVISQWIQEYIPKYSSKSWHATNGALGYNQRTRAGDPLSIALKVVCSSCNNGWMSDIVRKSKSDITPLLSGNWSSPDVSACERIAAWASLTAMVWETADPRTAVVPADERRFIMENGTAPPNWRSWIGLSDVKFENFYFHRGFILRNTFEIWSSQISFLTLGKLLIKSASSSSLRRITEFDFKPEAPIVAISPVASPPTEPSTRILDDQIAEFVDATSEILSDGAIGKPFG